MRIRLFHFFGREIQSYCIFIEDRKVPYLKKKQLDCMELNSGK